MVSWFLIRIPRQLGFPGGTSGKEPACQRRRRKRRGFHSWVGKMPWRRARQPTPVSLPGESHGERSLAGYSPWGHKESHTTEVTACTHAPQHTAPTAGSEEEVKSLLTRAKEESRKAGLKLSIQKTEIMASGPITSWQIDEEKVETVAYFIFLGSQITVDGDCSHEIKRSLLPSWEKSYHKPRQCIKKQSSLC